MKIGFIYYNFYPVTGGASVHGYHLAKELSSLGYTLYKLNGQPDPYTIRLKNRFTGLIRILKECDLIYVRMDYFLKPRNLITLIALAAGKKVLVELNSPSDELHLFGKNQRYIRKADRWMKSILKRTNGVIVVSRPIKTYCEKELGLANVHVVENGGEVFDVDAGEIPRGLKNRISEIREAHESLAVWSGSLNQMQNLSLLNQLAVRSPQTALIIIAKEEGNKAPDFTSENIFLLQELTRNEVSYVIACADIGLAFYGDYSWSRWGFYNSSLKVYEYLNNGLLTITNKPGTEVQKSYSNFKFARNVEEILTFTKNFRHRSPAEQNIRTWRHVAEETSNIIGEITKKSS
jgi:glycosyltransferase involved in cell wall biosynthesis